MKNKRGDIPITILVIGVVAVCGLALISFVLAKQSPQKNSLDAGVVEKAVSDLEEFYFYIDAGFSKEEAAEKVGASLSGDRLTIETNKTVRPRVVGEAVEKITVEYRVDLTN